MGMYNQGLNFLDRALSAGAISGEDALSQLLELDAAKAEAARARRTAVSETRQQALAEIMKVAQDSAAEGTPMSQLRPSLDAIALGAGLGKLPYGKLPGIDPLYEGGYSTVTPTVPQEDAAEIMREVAANAGSTDPEEALARVLSRAQQNYDPETYSRLAPALAKLVDSVYSTSS